MKSPLGAAVSARRKVEMPSETAQAPKPVPTKEGEPSRVQEMLAAMGEDEKLELFEALKSEIEPSESEGDDEGQG